MEDSERFRFLGKYRTPQLDVGFSNEGTHRLLHDHALEPAIVAAFAKAQSMARDPERCRKIAESRRGKPRPPHVIEAVRQAHLGSKHTEEARQRMSETHRRRGTLVPGTIPWTPEEDELVRTLPAEEVARRTGRSLIAVYRRRGKLGVPDGRTKTAGSSGRWRR